MADVGATKTAGGLEKLERIVDDATEATRAARHLNAELGGLHEDIVAGRLTLEEAKQRRDALMPDYNKIGRQLTATTHVIDGVSKAFGFADLYTTLERLAVLVEKRDFNASKLLMSALE